MEELAKYGVTTKPEMQGLTPDQIRDLNLGTFKKTLYIELSRFLFQCSTLRTLKIKNIKHRLKSK